MIGGALVGAAWWFHSSRIAPLVEREVSLQSSLADVRQRLGAARVAARNIIEQEQKSADARAGLTALLGARPTGPAVVWFPVRLNSHLQRFGIAEAGIRLNATVPERGLAGFHRGYWHLNVPAQVGMKNLTGVLLAVAEIEEQESFVRVLDFSFQSSVEPPHWPAGGLNVAALLRK
ncbi:MAG: hypothetical protein ABMA13_12560 [Chthoniobacteraceae bacterium]